MIAVRRMIRIRPEKSPLWPRRLRRLSTTGTMMSLETMMATATEATITIAVAAEKPPMKVSRVTAGMSLAIGKASTKRSLDPPEPNCSTPAIATGSTKMLIATRYSGSSHPARRSSPSVRFSTTAT